jgi:hypothetical protein
MSRATLNVPEKFHLLLLGYQRIYDETTKYATEASVFSAPTSIKGMDPEVCGQLSQS